MIADVSEDAAALFESLHAKLVRVAYRMLGSVHDAQDVVQEAFIRCMTIDRGRIREPETIICRIVTRLCLDQLKSARRRRETKPNTKQPKPEEEEEADNDVTLPLMLA